VTETSLGKRESMNETKRGEREELGDIPDGHARWLERPVEAKVALPRAF